jgi:two-component system sensor histidine kinase BaeS
MRLRIAHQLSLLLAGAVVLAVLAVGSVSLWTLRNGFTDYLRLRDDEQLTRLVALLEQRAAADPSMAWLRGNREAQRAVLDELQGRPPRPEPGPREGPPEDNGDRPPERRPPHGPGRPPPRPPPGPGGRGDIGGDIGDRIVVRDAQGAWLAGRPQPPNLPRTVRAVQVNGAAVAFVELSVGPAPEGLDARFLQRQSTSLLLTALATIIVTVLAGWWIAGRWSRPLRQLQLATHRIARGESGVRIPVPGAQGGSGSGAVEIDDLVADVNAMVVALATLEDSRRQWIAQISHELRTPLAVLRGEMESIEDGARQPTPAVMASLREEVAQLTRLVDDLHTLAVADLGQMPCHFTGGDANAAIERMARRFETRAGRLGLSLDIEPASGSIPAQWDFGRIEQLLSNLLENSLRYTHAPGRIRVRWRTQDGVLQLLVEDSAPGVPLAQLDKLFDPLFRGDAARSRTGQHGSGLGLSIVRAIVRSHRGQVLASAGALGGLAVQVELPLQPQQLERRKRSA